MKGAKITI